MTEPWANFGSLSKGHVLGDRPSPYGLPSNQIVKQADTCEYHQLHFVPLTEMVRCPICVTSTKPYDWAKQGI